MIDRDDFLLRLIGKTKDEWLEEGNIYYCAHMFEKALFAYQRAIHLDPLFAEAYCGKGEVLKQLERYSESLVACEKAIRLNPGLPRAYNNKGDILRKLDKRKEAEQVYTEAVNLCERLIRINPKNDVAYREKGTALYRLNRDKEAEVAHKQALQINPKLTLWHIGLGNVLAPDIEEGLIAYERAVQLEPYNADCYKALGYQLYCLEKYGDALTVLNYAIELDSKDSYPHERKGDIFIKLGCYEEALIAYQRVLQLDPDSNDTSFYDSMAYTLEKLGRFEEAKKFSDIASEREYDPRDYDIY